MNGRKGGRGALLWDPRSSPLAPRGRGQQPRPRHRSGLSGMLWRHQACCSQPQLGRLIWEMAHSWPRFHPDGPPGPHASQPHRPPPRAGPHPSLAPPRAGPHPAPAPIRSRCWRAGRERPREHVAVSPGSCSHPREQLWALGSGLAGGTVARSWAGGGGWGAFPSRARTPPPQHLRRGGL